MTLFDLLKRIPGILKSPETWFIAGKQWLLDCIAWFLSLFGIKLPEWAFTVVSILIVIVAIIAVFLVMFALMSVLERKILARMQNRYGPNRVGFFKFRLCGLLQPAADGIKMLTKEDIVPRTADKIVHFLAPIIMVVPALILPVILPYGRGMVPVELSAGILFFFAVGAGTELAVFMAGWSSNNKYSILGAMRAVAQMISYELPLVMSAVVVALVAGTLSPNGIVEAQGGYVFDAHRLGFLLNIPNWFVLTPWGFVACLLFYIGALAESNRSPFDLPEGESELVAGHLTEYSGFKYAIFFMAEYVGMFAINGLLVTLFLGGYQAPLPFLEFAPSWFWFFAKLACVAFSMVWVRATLPRFRIDQMMQFAWKFMLPMSFVALIAAAIWYYTRVEFIQLGYGPLTAGAVAWIICLVIVGIPYLILGRLCFTRQHTPDNRQYLFSE